MASMTISVNDNVKRSFSQFCEEVGLTSSAVLNVCMITIARERRIPFPIAAPQPQLADDEARQLSEDIAISRREFAEGKGIPLDAASRDTLAALHAHCARRRAAV